MNAKKVFSYKIDKEKELITIRYLHNLPPESWIEYASTIPLSLGKILIFQSDNDFQKISDILCSKEKFPKTHPFRLVGHMVFNLSNEVFIKCLLLQATYCSLSQKRLTGGETTKLSIDFFKFKGATHIYTTKDITTFPIQFEVNEELVGIHSMTYICPWVEWGVKNADCVELDCSFKLFKPYVYCVVLIIKNNESLPIGFIMGPTENRYMFELFYNDVKKIDESLFSILTNLPIITDEGVSLTSFAELYKLEQYNCYRHLIEKFGSSSEIGGIVKCLLFSQTKSDFINNWNTNKERLLELFHGKLSEKNKQQFLKLFKTEYSNGDFSTPMFSEQALWKRAEKRIPTCSNHSESAHSHLNKACAGIQQWGKRFNIILNYIEKRYQKFSERNNFKKLIRRIIKKSKYSDHRETCSQCKFNCYLANLYGEDIPCKHTVHGYSIENKKFDQPVKKELSYCLMITENEKLNWTFPVKNHLRTIEIDEFTRLFIVLAGKPDFSFYKDIVDALPTQIEKEEFHQYIETLFIYFSSHMYAQYIYNDQSHKAFDKFVRFFIFDKKDISVIFNQLKTEFHIEDAQDENRTQYIMDLHIRSDCSTKKKYQKNENFSLYNDDDDKDENKSEETDIFDANAIPQDENSAGREVNTKSQEKKAFALNLHKQMSVSLYDFAKYQDPEKFIKEAHATLKTIEDAGY